VIRSLVRPILSLAIPFSFLTSVGFLLYVAAYRLAVHVDRLKIMADVVVSPLFWLTIVVVTFWFGGRDEFKQIFAGIGGKMSSVFSKKSKDDKAE